MSIDARLREGLQRSMSAIDADAERHLQDAQRRGHRHVVVRRAVAVVVAVAAVAIVVLAAPTLLDVLHGQRPQPASKPSPLPIAGNYLVTITPEDAATAGAPTSTGTWVLRVRGDGVLQLASLKNAEVGGSTQYQLSGNEILTTALASSSCTGVGRYAWSRSGSTLTFTLVSDPCALRVAIFASHPWRAA